MKKYGLRLVGGVVCLYSIYLYKRDPSELALSSGLLPGLAGLVLLFLGEVPFEKKGDRLPLLFSGIIAGYTGLWYILGARLSTLIFVGLGLFILKEEKLSRSLFIGLGLTLFIDLLFARFFGIQLP